MATKIALILGGLQLGAAYKPFGGLDELRPTNPEAFCKEAPDNSGLKHCKREIRRELSDGAIVTMNWEVHMDPSNILSLDAESEKGVRLLECSEDSLSLVVPETHKSFIKTGKFVVGSHFLHNCEHLKGDGKTDAPEHLYARIESVERMNGNTVKLTFQDVGTIASVANHVSAYFEYSPAEARDLSEFPARRTNAQPLNLNPAHEDRKLAAEGTWGNPTSEAYSDGGYGAFQSLLDYVPQQVSNLGWNWDFELNTTSTPQINYTIPGGEGSIILKKPYVRAHATLYFNFSSNLLNDFSTPPDVKFRVGLKGHAIVSGKMNSELRIDDSVAGDPFNRHELPILRHLAGTMWLGTVEFSVGHLPVAFTPGVQFQAKAYHMGRFLGSLQLGIHTHMLFNPELSFDTKSGMSESIKGEFLDVELWPPTWLLYTNRFEMGMLLEPQMWIKGRMGSIKDAMWGMSLKPYFNISILRSGAPTNAFPDAGCELVLYPFRVTGLDGDEQYLVEVEANGKRAQTSIQMNFGILEYHDRPEAFRFGHISQEDLLQEPIKVTLKKGNGTQQTVIGTQTIFCTEMLNGECTPSPMEAQMNVAGQDVFVSVTGIWKRDPLPWFASKIRGVAISFPRILLRGDVMKSVQNDFITNAKDINLRVTRNGKIYSIPLAVNLTKLQTEGTNELLGNKMLEMGPMFLDAWKQCSDNMECSAPTISLMHGETLIGSNAIPEIPWSPSNHPLNNIQSYQGAFDMGTMNIPVHLALFTPENQFDSIGTASMNVEVTNPSQAAFFVYPIGAEDVPVDYETSIIWSVGDARADVLTFALTAMKVVNNIYVPLSDWSDLFAAQCSFNSVGTDQYHRNTDIPCTFSHLVTWNSSHFTQGDRVVLRLEWQEQNDGIAMTHELFSAVFDIYGKSKFVDADTNAGTIATTLQNTDNAGEGRCIAVDGMESMADECGQLQREQCVLLEVCEFVYDRLLQTQMSDMWMSHMSELQAEDCTQNKLSFAVGAGLYIKSTLKHLTIPDRFPAIGGLSEAPDITSGYVSLTPNGPMINESFADLFPDSLCSDGMCSGELPGCPSENHDMRSYPRIVFNTSKNFTFYRESSLAMKHLIAYAFSVLPEVVDVVVKSIGDWETGEKWTCQARPGQEVFAEACSTVPRQDCLHHVRCTWQPSSEAPATTPLPLGLTGDELPVNAWHAPEDVAPAPVLAGGVTPAPLGLATVATQAPTLAEATANTVSPLATVAPILGTPAPVATRRLQSPETQEDEVSTSSFEVSFNDGLPFIVDRQLLEVLLRHGAFDDLKDIHPDGDLKIVSFDVTNDVRAGIADVNPYADQDALNRPQISQSTNKPVQPPRVLSLGILVFIVAFAMLSMLAIRSRKSYSRVVSDPNLEEGSSDEASASEEAPEEQRFAKGVFVRQAYPGNYAAAVE